MAHPQIGLPQMLLLAVVICITQDHTRHEGREEVGVQALYAQKVAVQSEHYSVLARIGLLYRRDTAVFCLGNDSASDWRRKTRAVRMPYHSLSFESGRE